MNVTDHLGVSSVSQGSYEPGKRHWLKVKKDYLNEGAMADTADLVVLGAFYGKGSNGVKKNNKKPSNIYCFSTELTCNRHQDVSFVLTLLLLTF